MKSTVPERSELIRRDASVRCVQMAPDTDGRSGSVDDSRADARGVFIAALAEAIQAGMATGDRELSRVAHEALGRLL